MSEVLVYLVDLVWGPVLIALLLLGGVYLFFLSQGKALAHFSLGIRLLFGFSDFGQSKSAKGQLSHFKALSNALASTIGLGNIAGVAVAISQGGPGSLFWMWVSGFIGMNTKFFESTLSLLFRGVDASGQVQGGPMYYIPKIFKGSLGVYLGIFFAVVGLIGTQAMFQTNQLAGYLNLEVGVPNWVTGVVMAMATGIVLLGGLRRIAQITSAVVPIMCVLYVGACLMIIGINITKVPETFMLIFTQAFSLSAVGGGAGGYAIVHVFQIGIKRGLFSNEAGAGTAPMAHGNAKTSEPVSEGLVAMLGPFIDTIVVCTMTALVILMSIDLTTLDGNIQGVLLTTRAFENNLGNFGVFILGLSIFFFSFSTMIGMANYNEKCWAYLFKKNRFLNNKVFIAVFSMMLFLGAVGTISDVVNFIDLGFGLMVYPNMLAILFGAPFVIKELKLKLK